MKPVLALSLILAGALASPAGAAPNSASGADEALAAKLASAAELADQNRRSEALNAEVNAKNRAIQARNDAAGAAFRQATMDYERQVAAQAAAAASAAAADAKAYAGYMLQMEAWKAAVATCKAGDLSKCQAPAAAAQTASAARPR